MNVDITRVPVGHIKPRWLEERAEVDIIVPPEARLTQPVSVMHLHGALDGSAIDALLGAARAEIEDGCHNLVVDAADVTSVSSAGVIGLYMVGAVLGGHDVTDLEGYAIMGQMRAAIEEGQPLGGLCVAAASQPVARALDGMGFHRICPLFATVDDALSEGPDG